MQIQTTGKLNVLAAVYGLKTVTNNITALITDGNPQTLKFTVTNKAIGEDGWKGQRKSITILYNYDGGDLHIAAAKEGDTLTIGEKEFTRAKSTPAHELAYKQKLSVLGATYGIDDITYKIKNLISPYNTLSFKADNNLFGDGWYGVAKTLIIILGHKDQVASVEVFTEREQCYLDLNDFVPARHALAV